MRDNFSSAKTVYLCDEINRRVTMREAAEAYGIKVNRNGFAICPFHHEKTASMRIYPGNGGWFCFGCHAGGTVVGFVEKFFNLDFNGAVIRIDYDFNLCLPIGKRLSSSERAAIELHAAKRAAEDQAMRMELARTEADYWAALSAERLCDVLIKENRPDSQDSEWPEAFSFALSRRCEIVEELKRAETVLQISRERGKHNGNDQLGAFVS